MNPFCTKLARQNPSTLLEEVVTAAVDPALFRQQSISPVGKEGFPGGYEQFSHSPVEAKSLPPCVSRAGTPSCLHKDDC